MQLPVRLREAWSLGGLTFRQLIVRTWSRMNENEILTRASAVSFYAMLALVPMLALLLTALVQLLPDLSGTSGKTVGFGSMTVEQLENSLRQALPEEGYKVVADQIGRMQKNPPFGLLSLGVLFALWTSSSLFLAIMDSLNRVYGVTETRSWIRLRLLAIVMTIMQAGILLVTLIAIVAGPEILNWLGVRGSSANRILLIQWIVIIVMLLFSFALTFYIGPDAEQRWEWITPGSLLGTFVFLVFTFAFRLYVQNFGNYDKTYGSLGGVMVLLLWFWVSSVVLLTAGQMNEVIENASPLGKADGEKADPTAALEFTAIPAKSISEGS